MRHRRALKRFFFRRELRGNRKFNISAKTFLTGVAALSVILFVLVQLGTNAVLSPLGHRLQSLNTEKNALIEENRTLEQDIAKSNSIVVIEVYSEDKFDLSSKPKKETIFVSNKSVQAINVE